MNIIAIILIMALFCNGVYLITRKGLLLAFIHEWYVNKVGGWLNADSEAQWTGGENKYLKFIYKPLFGCLPCMASIWGSVSYWALCDSWTFYPIAIVSTAALNLIINRIYDK